MADTRLSNLNTLCRLCLSEKLESLKGIFDDAIDGRCLQQKIFTSLGVEITSDDKLSVMVCTICIEKVNEWNLYKQNCMENQIKLEQLLQHCHSDLSEMNIQIKEEPIEDEVILPEPEVLVNGGDVPVKNELMEVDEFPPSLSPHPLDNTEMNENADPRKCTICEKMFSSAGNRKKHERIIHGMAPSGSVSGSELGSLSQDDHSQSSIDSQMILNDADSEQQKIQFAAGLKLLQRNSTPPISLESLSKIEFSYIEKCKAMASMYNSLQCACHNVQHPNLKGLLSHLRSLRIWFPVFTCYHCMITFTDRSTSTRHHLKCSRTALETLIKLSNLRKRSEVKTRLYQNYKCTKCKFMYSFHEDYCTHVDEEHALIRLPTLCSCGREFATVEDYKDHAYVSCLVDYYCDICFVTVKTLDEFQKHAIEVHDNSEGFVLLQDDNYRKRKTISPIKSPIKREQLDDSMILTGKRRRSSYYNKPPAIIEPVISETKVLNPLYIQKIPGTSCPICRREYSSNHNMLRHYRSHTQQEIDNYDNNGGLYDDSLYCCPDCGGMFSTNEWEKHKEMHKKKMCNECGKIFQFQSELDQHRSVHLNLKVYRDSKTKSYKSTMLSPNNDNKKQKIVVMCEICDIMFGTKDELKKHKTIHDSMPILELSSQSTKSTTNRRFSCNICNKQYAGYGGLWDHNRKKHPENKTPHSKEFPKQCKYCDKIFHTGGSYFMHKQMHERINQNNTQKKKQQNNETTTIKIKKDLDAIIDDEDIDVESYHTCKRCFKVFSNKYNLKNHMKSHGIHMTSPSNKTNLKHKPTKRVWCDVCHSPFDNINDLEQHKLEEHTETDDGMPNLIEDYKGGVVDMKVPFIFTCDVCVQTFISKFALKKHKETHIKEVKKTLNKAFNKSVVYCKHCKISFDSIEGLNHHMLKEHEQKSKTKLKIKEKQKKFVCSVCNKSFISSTALCAHQGWHKRGNTYLKQIDKNEQMYRKIIVPKQEPIDDTTINNDFQCRTCSAILPNDTALQIHILERHRNVNATIVPARCTICNLDFGSQEKYEEHKRYHETVENEPILKRFSCDYCSSTFSRNDSLAVHQRQYHSEHNNKQEKQQKQNTTSNKPLYTCSICSKGFDLPKDLRTHTINAHPF